MSAEPPSRHVVVWGADRGIGHPAVWQIIPTLTYLWYTAIAIVGMLDINIVENYKIWGMLQ